MTCTCRSSARCANCMFKDMPRKENQMEPNPLYMLMRNMTQRAHGPRPYDGILGATQEKVVAYEGDGAGTLDAAIEQAIAWVNSKDSGYIDRDEGTLIEIRVVAKIGQDSLLITPQAGACGCKAWDKCEAHHAVANA